MKKITSLLFLAFLVVSSLVAQEKITLEDIWRDYKFLPKSVPGFNFLNDGKHYSRLVSSNIYKYDITTGEQVGELFSGAKAGLTEFDSYEFNADESKLLIKTSTESIYRYSNKAIYWVYDFNTESLEKLTDQGKIMYATFSPDAKKVAWVYENNLYYKNLENEKITQITDDGAFNKIINGASDWVYEEEFALVRAFEWSPDSRRIAFFRFDESKVKEFTMMAYKDGLYPEHITFKYPKVGEKNAKVDIYIYDTQNNSSVLCNTDSNEELYFPRIKWTKDPNKLCIFRMNRHQNHLELLLADASNGSTDLLYQEKNKYYIDIHDHLTFLEDRKHFIWTSEKDGYNHIYLYDMNGKEVRQITKGDWEVTQFYGIDEKNKALFFQSTEVSPLQRYIYCINIKGRSKKQLTTAKGWNDAQFSSTFDYFVHNHSSANTPKQYTVKDRKGKNIRLIEDNRPLIDIQKVYGTTYKEFFTFENSNGDVLNGWMIKPPLFNTNKKHPVLMYEYGGPGSQSVKDDWDAFNYWWFQMLAQKGYVVACIDNRGTGGRGEAFKKMTYQQLGKYETQDQIDAAKYLGSLKYIDAERIGIFGWSYGGYLSSLCILKGNDTFKAAIAVAPVTNWKWYDTIYTERYMRTDGENPSGYKENSPVYFTDRLKGNYLLIHGMSDDNVHFQHAAEMAAALIKNNKQFDTYFYPNKNHGIYGGYTRLHLYQKMTDFLLENL